MQACDVLPARILDKIAFEPNTGCWLWAACDSADGYGRVWFNGRQAPAHRAVYQMLVGSIPPGLSVDHLCRTTLCVNPEHMELVTIRENILRGNGAAAKNLRKTHCPNGHTYDEANTRWWNGFRLCKTCTNARSKAYRSAIRALGDEGAQEDRT